MSDAGLQVQGLTAGYGRAAVLHGLDFELRPGQTGVVLGANGAGKTTLLRALSGLLGTVGGSARYQGRELLGRSPAAVLRAGIAHVPQGRGTFPELSVEDNLQVGGLTRPRGEVQRGIAHWYERLPRLAERRHQLAGSLSGGEQQMLAIARAFLSAPSLVLLDEPSLGLAPLITQQLFAALAELQRELGIAMLIVEQNAELALGIAEEGFVLEAGAFVDRGAAAELAGRDSIRQAYLGV